MRLETPQLCMLGRNAQGGMFGITLLKILITRMLELMGIDKHQQAWSPEQIDGYADLIYSEYYWLTMAEIKQFFARVELGVYKDNKNMTPPIFSGFLLQYVKDMEGARYDYFSQQAQKIKWEPPADPIPDERFQELMQDAFKAIGAEPEKTIAEKVGGEVALDELKEKTIEMARQLGVPDNLLETLKNKRK